MMNLVSKVTLRLQRNLLLPLRATVCEPVTSYTQTRFYRLRGRISVVNTHKKSDAASEPPLKPQRPTELLKRCTETDEPVDFAGYNPYDKKRRRCILCRTGVELNYKNPRLLSQFLSNFTGRLYERHITGLCNWQQSRVKAAISESRRAGYMPVFIKNPRFLKDPRLFDPMRPIRPNSF